MKRQRRTQTSKAAEESDADAENNSSSNNNSPSLLLSSLDRHHHDHNGLAPSEDTVADCSLLLPKSNNMNMNMNASPPRSRRKLNLNNSGNVQHSKAKAPKTLFSAVMRRTSSNTKAPKLLEDDVDNTNFRHGTNNENGLGTPSTSPQKQLATPTQTNRLISGRNRHLPKSPLLSPGGLAILKALDDANNLSLYQEPKKLGDDEDEVDGGGDGNGDDDARPGEEWYDATVYFNQEEVLSKDVNISKGNGNGNDGADTTNDNFEAKENLMDRMNAEKDAEEQLSSSGNNDNNYQLHSSIVEATRHSTELDDDDFKQKMNNRTTTPSCPEAFGLGVIDWSLKRRIRLQCTPGRCLPGESSSSSFQGYSSTSDEGFMHQLALRHMSTGTTTTTTTTTTTSNDSLSLFSGQGRNNPSLEDLAMAKWLASTMYYQHPAVHPLPSSMLQETTTNNNNNNNSDITAKTGNNTKQQRRRRRDLSSFIHGQHSIHHRVRLPAAGCMGGLGICTSNGDQDRMMNKQQHAKSSIATVSSLLNQRRHDWQEAFRSMFMSWKSRLKEVESSSRDAKKCASSTNNCELPTEDALSRCSFYCILPNQVILFRGGYAEGKNASCSTDAAKMVPMIVFSSTTPSLRSKLVSLGVDLRLFTGNKQDDDIEGERHKIFSEHDLPGTGDEQMKAGGTVAEGDAESVHAELDAIKWADDEKGKVTVNLKKRAQQSKGDQIGYTNIPPLFVSGDDDCAAVYELLMNTCGLSTNVQAEQPKLPTLDVPLLLCRSLGPCMHTTLRTLTIGGRRDCGYMQQISSHTNANGTLGQEHQSTDARAAIELRGPILPCALRDLTCAMVNWMVLDKLKQDESFSQPQDIGDISTRNGMHDESNASSSHQFAMFVHAHEGEWATPTPKSTGSSSSLNFNGSNVPLLPRQDVNGDASTDWLECEQGDYINVLVWDISRKSTVSFSPLSASTSL